MLNKIEEFVKKDISECRYGSGFGSGFESGFGYGSENGYGDGCGDGTGYGDGEGSGKKNIRAFDFEDGFINGDGFIYGYGEGFGSGDGTGYGSKNGYRDISSLKSINNQNIYHIDDVPTIITNVHNNIAKGKILNDDFSYEDCYIAKGQGYFAHGETIKDAVNSLQEKIFSDLDPEEKIAEFRKAFKNNEKYKGTEFYKWHHILTGSCKMGRDNFVHNHNINLNNEFTVKEFIEICENSYGGKIIKELKKYYK